MSQETRPPSLIGPFNIYGLLALAGIIGPVVLVATNLAASFSTSGYNPVHNTISDLAWSPMGWLQSIGFLTIGILVELFAAGLLFSIRGSRGFGLGIGLLVCFGFGLLLIGAFRDDPIGTAQTIQGTIHKISAITIFSIFPVASLLIAISLRKDTYWKKLYLLTIVTTVLALGLSIGELSLQAKLNWLGLYERIMVANTIIWVAIMAIQLLRLSFSSTGQLKRPRIF